MSTKQTIGIIINFTVLGLSYLYFRYGMNNSQKTIEKGGVQEVEVVVKGVYSPNVIEAKAKEKLRISFKRDEEKSCSEYVIIPDFKIRKKLEPYKTTIVEFIPDRKGEFKFTCSMGMYSGKIIVK